jgi:foldase protein PrsA
VTRHLRTLLALLALAIPALTLAACGGVPGNAVAEIDGQAIEKTSFNHWMNVAAKSGGQPGASVPKPPDYKDCIAQLRKQQPKPAKGQPKVNDADLKKQCDQQYKALRDQVVQLLASFEWIKGEAKDQDVKVSDAEVKKRIDEIKKQQFPKKGDFEKFLKDSGYTQADIEAQTRTELLTNKIRDKVTKGEDKVSDKEIQDYYNKNKQRFAQPERRDLRVVLTKNKAKADQAKAAIKGGQDFGKVAKKLSIDQASKAQGGKLPGVAKGQQEKALDTAVFAAKKGQLQGPVKTQFGYYVFEVTKVTPASQQTLDQAKATIKQLLVSQKQQKAIETFAKKFQKKWKERTECRKGYVTQSCKGAKPTPTPTPPAQPGAPQQAPTDPNAPQQAPPSGTATP